MNTKYLILLWNANKKPFLLQTSYCSGVSCLFQSSLDMDLLSSLYIFQIISTAV